MFAYIATPRQLTIHAPLSLSLHLYFSLYLILSLTMPSSVCLSCSHFCVQVFPSLHPSLSFLSVPSPSLPIHTQTLPVSLDLTLVSQCRTLTHVSSVPLSPLCYQPVIVTGKALDQGIVGYPPKHFGDWCSHTSGSEFISNETKSSWR